MKKVLSIVLAIAMIATMSAIAFADPNASITSVTQNNTATIDVAGVYSDDTEEVDSFKVDLTWTALSFTFTDGNISTWNTTTHKWDVAQDGAWSDNGAGTFTVAIENHSNKAVDVALSYADAEGGATTAAADATTTVAAAALNETDAEAPAGTTGEVATDISVEGRITSADTVLGTFTVTVTENVPAAQE